MVSIRRLLVVASLVMVGGVAPVAPAYAEEPPPAPTFTIFATREGLVGHRTANGHIIRPRDRFVALPSWRALSSRGGHEFQVRVTYRGRSVVLPVWDVGPWNTDDDYWSPQRRYADLPVGVPMAQAAFYDGYNRGRDERGRRVRDPNGIDIADGAFWDDLGMTRSDWVEVTFLWLGADTAPASVPAPATPELPAPTDAAALVDDGAAGYEGHAKVAWYTGRCGQNGQHSWTYGTSEPARGENHARWSASLSGPGFYEVLASIPSCGDSTTRAARYRVLHNGAVTDVTIDQAAAAGSWVSLGIYHIDQGPAVVELTDVTGDDGRAVRFDAVQWVPRHDAAPPSARVNEALKQADGSVLVRWSGADDVSGVAAYDVQARKLPDGGWSDWQIDVTASEAAFVPPEPGVYAFRARARDWVGNVQPWGAGDDALIDLTR